MEKKFVTLNNGEYICDIDISVQEWKDILTDDSLMKDYFKDTLVKFHAQPGHKSTCKALGEKYNTSPHTFNLNITRFAAAVQKKLNRFEVFGTDGKPTFWNIPMTGRAVGKHFEWKLRPELVKAMDELGVKEEHFLQRIYNNPLKGIEWVYNEWFPNYKENVKVFLQYAISGEWDDNVLQQLIKNPDNGISSLKQGNFTKSEFENIKNDWHEIADTLKSIATQVTIDQDNYNKIHSFLRKYTSINKYAATNRIIAAILPNFTTTTVSYEYLLNVIGKIKDVDADYPDATGNWLTDNINFIKYCNAHVKFKHPWHSSLFAWYLKEYIDLKGSFIEEDNMKYKQYTDLLIANKNLILTGAPGTGKTYLAKEIANALGAECEFVQFHPSYDYTDFVEGLRPTTPDENGNIGFERKDGAFKAFCKRALAGSTTKSVDNFDEAWDNLLDLVRSNLADGNTTKIGSWSYGLSTRDSLKYASTNTASSYTFTITKKNVYDAYRNLKARPSGGYQKDMVDVVDFMKKEFQLKEYQEGEIQEESESRKFVFIIDEINRGEISKVFGELFFSIDPGYRGSAHKVTNQYANLIEPGDIFHDGFFVPENVYIIGTMNDIDRSVESLDFAMRRRFAWKEIRAIERTEMWNGIIDEWKEEALVRMTSLNDAIENVQGLGSSFHIGPAYFLKLANYQGDFNLLWDYHLRIVLFEYLRGLPGSEDKLQKLEASYMNPADPLTDVGNN